MSPLSEQHGRSEPDPRHEVLSRFPDKELIEALETAFEKVIYVDDKKQISAVAPHDHLELWKDFAAAWSEALRRGYTEEDLGRAINILATKTGFLKELHDKLGRTEGSSKISDVPAWKQFEQFVAKLHSVTAEDCLVTLDEKISDRTTATPRQVDVTLRFKKSFYDFLVIIECRHQKANMTIGDVEAFATKLDDTKGHKGVIVASSGFDSGAVAKAAFYGIDLYTLSEAHELDWQTVVRDIISRYPFPDKIEFDPVDPASFSNAPTGHADLSFAEMYLADSNGRPFENLASLLSKLSIQLMREQVPLPARVHVNFEPPLVLRVDRLGVVVSIKASTILFAAATSTCQRTLYLPEISRRYQYRNISTGEATSFSLD